MLLSHTSQGISKKSLEFLEVQCEIWNHFSHMLIYSKSLGMSMNKIFAYTSASWHLYLGYPFQLYDSIQASPLRWRLFIFLFLCPTKHNGKDSFSDSTIFTEPLLRADSVFLFMICYWNRLLICVPSRMWAPRGGDGVIHLCLQCLSKCSALRCLLSCQINEFLRVYLYHMHPSDCICLLLAWEKNWYLFPIR